VTGQQSEMVKPSSSVNQSFDLRGAEVDVGGDVDTGKDRGLYIFVQHRTHRRAHVDERGLIFLDMRCREKTVHAKGQSGGVASV